MVTLSSNEAEYFSLADATTEAICMTRLSQDFNQVTDAVFKYANNQSSIHIVGRRAIAGRYKVS